MNEEYNYNAIDTYSLQVSSDVQSLENELNHCYREIEQLKEQIERDKKQAYWQGGYDVRKELDLGDIPKQITVIENFIDYLDEYNYDIHSDDIDNYGNTRMDKDEVLDEYIKTLKES